MKAAKRKKLEKAGWKVGNVKQFLKEAFPKNHLSSSVTLKELYSLANRLGLTLHISLKEKKKATKSRSKNSSRSKTSRAKRASKTKGRLKIIRQSRDEFGTTTDYGWVPSAGRVGGQGGYAYGGPVV